MSTVEDLVLAHTTLDGRPVEMRLRLAPYADLAWLMQGTPPPGEERLWMTQRLTKEIERFDGRPMTVDLATSLLRHPRLLGDFIEARNHLYQEARRRGVMFALCPSCRQGEAELSFAFLELCLRMTPPPLTTDDGVWLPPPAIAGELRRGRRRSDLPLAAQVRVELPSHRMGLSGSDRPGGGVLRVLDGDAERDAWRRLWPEGSWMPEDRAWWYPENPAFRALIRYAAAVERFTPVGTPSLQTVERLAAIDVAYLDMAIIAAEFTDEPAEERPVPGLVPRQRTLEVVCAHCQTRYLPLV